MNTLKYRTTRLNDLKAPSLHFSPARVLKLSSPHHSLDAHITRIHAMGPPSDGIKARHPISPSTLLYNSDLAPVLSSQRTFSTWDMFSLWVGLVVCVASYYLAGGLVELGMSWKQGLFTIFIANCIVLFPMICNATPGVKYGIPFSVLARSSFGVRGAILPAVLRALVACGWFGIQTYLGGAALYKAWITLSASTTATTAPVVFISWLGISLQEYICFLLFWLIQLGILLKGLEGIRILEKYSAPVLIGMSGALLWWAYQAAGGFGPMLSAPGQLVTGSKAFWKVFIPAITANVGFWATLSLNIPDFSRYAKSQRAQVLGQAIGLPLFMAAFTFVGLAVTSATVVIYGQAISDPIALLGKLEGVWPVVTALLGLSLATLTTNLAANVVAPAGALVALNPSKFTFTSGAILTSLTALFIMPWKLVSSSSNFFNWLVSYSIIVAPIAGIMLVDYHVIRKGRLNIDALYTIKPNGRYYYSNGWNPAAIKALIAGVVPTVPGFLNVVGGVAVPALAVHLYEAAWFVGFGVAAVVYYILMKNYYSTEK